ncbi:MAG: TIGR03915 family putative DNA repair protein [Lachnospiraceae bacterium]|nr:TIGR03915 family putative DNA repair protein [Lachnospiraceae bacterium]
MQDRNILVCEDSPEGIFSAVYYAYEQKMNPNITFIQLNVVEDYELFSKYFSVETDFEKAEKVDKTIVKRFGEISYSYLWYALYSRNEERGNAVYHTIARGLSGAYKGELVNYLQDPYVLAVSKMRQSVWCEAHHYMGFIRFQELKNKILYSEIEPKNQVLPMIARHFADRFPGENFIIKDKGRNFYVVHEAGKGYVFHQQEEQGVTITDDMYSKEEVEIQHLFQIFHKTIAIEERTNLKLQRQLLPLRFRENMIDFC